MYCQQSLAQLIEQQQREYFSNVLEIANIELKDDWYRSTKLAQCTVECDAETLMQLLVT